MYVPHGHERVGSPANQQSMTGEWFAALPLYREGSACGSNVKSRGGGGVYGMLKAGTVPFRINTALKGRHHAAPREYSGSTRIKTGKRSTDRWARTWPQGRHGACGCKLHNKDATVLFPIRCPEPTSCLSMPSAPCRTLHRHVLREGMFLTSVGTRVRPY